MLASVTKHASISSVLRSPYSVVGNIVVGTFVFTNGANAIPTGSTILKLNDLPGNFRATYDFIMNAGGSVIMAYAKFKELTKYFDFKAEVPTSRLPEYTTEYVRKDEEILLGYKTHRDHAIFTNKTMILF